MSPPHNISIGMKVGSLTVMSFVGIRNSNRIWRCHCECGKKIEKTTKTISEGIRKGTQISCGCVHKENARRLGLAKRKHGFARSRLESIRNSMVRRCTQPWRHNYKHYGGRGIEVCAEWKNNPQSFYDWAINNGYRDDLSIERINNDGNYEPSNCKFVPWKKQARNRRNSIQITFDGKTKCIAEWSRDYGIDRTTIKARLDRGWSVERALTEPVTQ